MTYNKKKLKYFLNIKPNLLNNKVNKFQTIKSN